MLSRVARRDGGCAHLDQVRDAPPRTIGCEECLALHMRWVHLRVCRTCGHVGCCNQSVGKHAYGHFVETGHPIMRSLEEGETWSYCWLDQRELP